MKVLASLVERLCGSLAEDLASDSVCAKQIILKVKRSDFTVKQHSMTLMSATSCAAEFAPVAVRLLHKEMPATLRLVGVKVTQLVPNHCGGNSAGGSTMSSSGILQRAMQASDSSAAAVCPICMKVIVGEPPNVRVCEQSVAASTIVIRCPGAREQVFAGCVALGSVGDESARVVVIC